MLKKRIVPLMLMKSGRLVKSVSFTEFRDVGDPVKSAMVYSDQDADELVLLNLDGESGISDLLGILPDLTKNVFMPLSLGGGVWDFSTAASLINNGADKVVINSSSYKNPELIKEISNHFGVQSVVVSIDVKKEEDRYILYSENGRIKQGITLQDHVLTCIEMGAGEILLQRIDYDGAMDGLDVELGDIVNKVSSIPVILASGVGDYEHIKQGFLSTDVSAISCGSLFNFTDSNPVRAKSFLSNYGIEYKQS